MARIAKVYLSEGVQLADARSEPSYLDAPLGYRFDCGLTADVNGDGKDDLIDTVPRPARVYLSSGSPPDLLTTVANDRAGDDRDVPTVEPNEERRRTAPCSNRGLHDRRRGRGGSARTNFQYDGGRYDRTSGVSWVSGR
jgi:hypothetical protein